MVAKYDLLLDYGIKSGTDPEELSVSAYWIVAVVRFKYPLTFSRADYKSFSDLFEKAVEVRGKPLIITDDCVSCSVSAPKGSPSLKLQCTLLPGNYDYLSEIFTDDWVFTWMFNNDKDAKRILENLQSATIKPCNDWNSGLKFVGRVDSIVKNLVQTPDGIRSVRYSMTADGFTELTAKVNYNPYLLRNFNGIGKYMQSLNIALNEFIKENGTGVESETAIKTFLDLLLGKGVKPNQGLPTGTSSSGANLAPLRSTDGAAGEYAYIVPTMVGQILGKKHASEDKKAMSASDLIDTITGVQNYGSQLNEQRPWEAFLPSNLEDAKAQRKQTQDKMKGSFLPVEPQLNNKTVWSILNAYLNPFLNEMYVALRADHDGKIVPTIVARQLPFSSRKYEAKTTTVDAYGRDFFATTKFLDLPRWYIHPILITGLNLGRSRALKFNYVQILGDPGQMKSTHSHPTLQIIRNPPIRDDLDVARSGLRDYQQTALVSLHDLIETTGGESNMKDWTKIIADIVHGQHLALTGSCSLFGVQSPICVGDNVEIDGTVLHIESVSHQCAISPDGQKTFRTNLALSHGMAAEPTGTDLGLYSGVSALQNRSFEPGVTNEQVGIVPPAPEGLSFDKALVLNTVADNIEKQKANSGSKAKKWKFVPKQTKIEQSIDKIKFENETGKRGILTPEQKASRWL